MRIMCYNIQNLGGKNETIYNSKMIRKQIVPIVGTDGTGQAAGATHFKYD